MRDVTKDQIVKIAVELKDVLNDPTDGTIFDAVEDCIGRRLTYREKKLVVVAFETDAKTARSCFWYS